MAVTLIASRRQPEDEKTRTQDQSESNGSPLDFLDATTSPRHTSRLAPPPPELTPEQKEQLIKTQSSRNRKKLSRLQRELPLEIVFKGRFEKSEPTIRHGEDLDLPTYIRRGVPLN
jgi:cell division protein FtsZ